MAAIFQIRRGSGSVSLVDGELYVNKGIDSLQYAVGDREITLLKLDELNTGTLNLNGGISASGDITASNMYVSGNVVLGGTITIGDTTNDSVIFNADLSSSIIPDATNTYDLGSTSKVYRNIYSNNVSASSFTGSLFGMGDPTSFSASVDDRLDQLQLASSSLQSFTSSQESKNTTLETYTTSVNSRLDRLQESTASLNSFTSSQEGKDIVIASYTSSMNLFTSSQESKDTTIASYTSSMNTFTSSTNSRLSDIESYTSSLKTAIDVTGGDTRIKGNLIVDGTQTSLNTTETFIEDISITLASGSTTSAIADGAGLNIAGANVSMSWDNTNTRLYFNTNIAALGSISSSTIIGLNDVSVTTYSTSVDSRLVQLQTNSGSSNSRLTNLESFTGSQNTKNSTLATYTSSLELYTASVNSDLVSIHQTTSSLNIFTASIFGTNEFTASTKIRLDNLENTSASISSSVGQLNSVTASLHSYTSSTNIRLDNIELTTSSLNSSIVQINSVTASLNSWTGSGFFNAYSTSVDNLLDGLRYDLNLLTPAGLTASFDNLNLFTSSANSRLNNLESTTASLNTETASLQNYTSSANIRLSNLETTTASLNTSISEINLYTSSLKAAFTASGVNVTFNGDLTVKGTTTVVNSTTLNIGDNIIELNYGGSQTTAGIYVKDETGGSTTSGSLLWDSTNDYWKAGKLGSESQLLTADGMSVVSSSTQITSLLPTGTVSGSSQTIANLPAGTVSGSSQVTLSSTNGGGISSQVRFGSLGIDMAASVTAGRIDAAGDIVAYSTSDIRLKENIQPIQNALSKVETISGNEYNWKEEFEYIHGFKGNDVGIIAQEIQKVLPEAIHERDNGYLGVNYEKIIPLLIQSIKELSAKVKELENK